MITKNIRSKIARYFHRTGAPKRIRYYKPLNESLSVIKTEREIIHEVDRLMWRMK